MPAPLLSPALSRAHTIRHGFFTREGGVSTGIYGGLNVGYGSNDDAAAVTENRARVAAALKMPSAPIVTLYQVHGATALTVAAPVNRFNLPKADAVVSKTPGLVVGVLTADCCPVLFADPDAGVVAAAHAGWRGAVSGVLEAAVEEMQRQGARRERIIASHGPCIGQPAYEVAADFITAVGQQDPAATAFLEKIDTHGKSHFDLGGYVAARLAGLGLAAVDHVSHCTHANESKFFSYRRSTQRKEPDYGRQISAIVVA